MNCENKYENTPLHLAALRGRLDIVQYLISERGCDPICRSKYSRTPLHYACQGGRLDVVKYLMEDVMVDSHVQTVILVLLHFILQLNLEHWM